MRGVEFMGSTFVDKKKTAFGLNIIQSADNKIYFSARRR